jgi:alpha-1,2-mannosyltransferase
VNATRAIWAGSVERPAWRALWRTPAAVFLTFEIGLLIFLVLGTHGMIVPLNKPVTTDFASFYAAGMLADEGAPELVYDQAAHHAAEERATEPGIEYQFFYYPPVFLLACAPLARVPYLLAFVLFETVTGLLCLPVVRRILHSHDWTDLILALSFPAVFWTIGLGQNALLSAALFGAATLLIDQRPLLAGLLFGALCYKPHLGVLIPFALIAGRRWRALAAAAAAALALCGASAAIFGVDTWHAYLDVASGSVRTYEFGRIDFAGMISVFGAVRLAGGTVAVAYAAQIAVGLVATAIVIWVWWREADLETRSASLIAATLLTVPVILLYDLTLAGIAMAWLIRSNRQGNGLPLQKASFAAIFLIALVMRSIGSSYQVPLGPIPALMLLAFSFRNAATDRLCATGPLPRIQWQEGVAGAARSLVA